MCIMLCLRSVNEESRLNSMVHLGFNQKTETMANTGETREGFSSMHLHIISMHCTKTTQWCWWHHQTLPRSLLHSKIGWQFPKGNPVSLKYKIKSTMLIIKIIYAFMHSIKWAFIPASINSFENAGLLRASLALQYDIFAVLPAESSSSKGALRNASL